MTMTKAQVRKLEALAQKQAMAAVRRLHQEAKVDLQTAALALAMAAERSMSSPAHQAHG